MIESGLGSCRCDKEKQAAEHGNHDAWPASVHLGFFTFSELPTGCTIRAHPQFIHSRPPSTRPFNSPQRRCSSKNAHSATSGGTGVRMLAGIIRGPVGVRDVHLSLYVTTAFVPVGSARLVDGGVASGRVTLAVPWSASRPETRSDGAIVK
jgi:hypothetical protein